MPLTVRPFDQAGQRGRIGILQCDGIDLDLQPGRPGRRDPRERTVKRPAARQRVVGLRVQRIERDIDPLQARSRQPGGEFLQPRRVCCQAQFFETGAKPVPQPFDQGDHVAPHQRLAARDADLGDAARDEGERDLFQLLEGQNLGLRQEFRPRLHAIPASKVAAIGHRQAQIGDPPPEGVDQGSRGDVRRSIHGRIRASRHRDMDRNTVFVQLPP